MAAREAASKSGAISAAAASKGAAPLPAAAAAAAGAAIAVYQPVKGDRGDANAPPEANAKAERPAIIAGRITAAERNIENAQAPAVPAVATGPRLRANDAQ